MAKKKPSKPSKARRPSKASKPAGKSAKAGARKPGRAGKPPAAKGIPAASRVAYAVAVNPQKDSQERQEALTHDPTTLFDSPKTFASVLKVLRDPGEPIDVRLTALQAI